MLWWLMVGVNKLVLGMILASVYSHAGDDIVTASPMVEHSAPVQLEIPETQPATPRGSSDGQQASPLLMSIKKLVHHQEAVECAAVASGTSEASASSSGLANSRVVLGPGKPNP